MSVAYRTCDWWGEGGGGYRLPITVTRGAKLFNWVGRIEESHHNRNLTESDGCVKSKTGEGGPKIRI